MKINLEILDTSYIYDEKEIGDLNTKELVPKMVFRRRLTRASKIAIYLASKVNYENQRVIFGSSFGELHATANILDSINKNEPISPTHFQNSVYNTSVSYLSILSKNQNEIMTISSGDDTSKAVLTSGAIKALDGDELILMVIESLNIPNIEQVNSCIDYLECGVALRVRVTEKEGNIKLDNSNDLKLPLSCVELINIAKSFDENKDNIVEVQI